MKILPSFLLSFFRGSFWRKFKKNRRGMISLVAFLVLFVLSLFAELWINDKPLLVVYDNHVYFPVFERLPETTFDGTFETEADYHDPFVRTQINEHGFMVWPLISYSYDSFNEDLSGPAPTSPDLIHWLGTDDQGRDVLARVIYGFRISVLFGLTLTFFSTLIGILAGAVQGYFGGWIDLLMQRFLEIWSGLPVLYLLIILGSIITPNFWWLLGLMLLFSWMSLVGLVRAEFLKIRNMEYVRAAQAMGISNFRIMVRHILPNAFVASLTFMPFILSGAITTLTSLDFLGFGLPPGSPSLGELLAQGKANLHAPWLGLVAFFSLAIMLTLLIFIGEAVRDTLNPRKKGSAS